MNAKQALEQMQQRADLAYTDGDYARAYRLYDKMQKIGDHFSEYRLATMYENGWYVEQNLIEAYAWSYLAAESGRQAYRDYHESIKQKLSAADLKSARERAGNLIVENGVYVNMVENRRLLRDASRKCTGSRLGSRCDAVSLAAFNCSTANELEPDLECLRIGSLGLASLATAPADLKAIQKAIDDYIDQYQPGRVELGDFELIGDPVPAESEK